MLNDVYQETISLFHPDVKKKAWFEELEEEACSACPTMTFRDRIIGSIICMLIGLCLSISSAGSLTVLLLGNPIPFAITYTLGNIFSISSTCFLYGPQSQFKKMFATTRLIATCIFFAMMIITLVLALYKGDIFLRVLWIILAIIFQYLALIWYQISFIPFARDIVKTFFVEYCCFSFCKNSTII